MKHKLSHRLLIVGVPCFNEERFLLETIRSIERQTFKEFNVLISDNASTDRTSLIALEAGARDSRFVYHRQPENIGSCGNFNYIRDVTQSTYLVWIGAHDLIAPDFLEHHITTLERDKRLSLSQSALDHLDEQGTVVGTVRDGDLSQGGPDSLLRYFYSIRQNHHNIGANSVFRREFLDGFRFTNVVGTDRIMLSHLAYRGPFANIDRALYQRRLFVQKHADYMVRLSGKENSSSSLNWDDFARAHVVNLPAGADKSPFFKAILWGVLRYYFPVAKGTAITFMLWTIRRVLKRIPFRASRASA